MTQYILKDTLVAEINKRIIDAPINNIGHQRVWAYNDVKDILDTLEVIDPYEQCIQYPSIEDGIKAHAEEYSFNIESELFNQLTKEQQELWRKEIEQACISGGNAGIELARDSRYKENLEVKEVDVWKTVDDINPPQADRNKIYCVFTKARYILATVINHPKDEELLQWKCTEFPFHRYDMCEGDKYMEIA